MRHSRFVSLGELQRVALLIVPTAAACPNGAQLFCQGENFKGSGDEPRKQMQRSHSSTEPFALRQFRSMRLPRQPQKDYHQLVNDNCVRAIAALINDVCDKRTFSNEEEQDILETATIHVLDEVAGVLPRTYVEMIRGKKHGEKHVFDKQDVDYFEKRLNDFVRQKVCLPYVDAAEEKMIVSCVVHVLVTAMIEQKGVEEILRKQKRTIIVEVFMKSMVGMFIDEEQRKKSAQHIVDHLKEIPFVPSPVVHKIVINAMEQLGDVIEEALNQTLDEVIELKYCRAEHAGVTTGDMAMRESFLDAVPLLKTLSCDQRARLAEALSIKTFKAGDLIIRKGEEGSEFYIVQDGEAKAVINGSPVMHYGPGGHFGELSLLNKQVRAADVIATSKVTLLSLGGSEFQKLLAPAHSLLENVPPPRFPQGEFIGHLRLQLFRRLSSKMPVLSRIFPDTILALVDEILQQMQDDKVEKAVKVLVSSGEHQMIIGDVY